jgi:crooked neck
MENRREEKVKTQKVIPVKNKTPAPIQITAEQLLREAKERQLEYVAPVCCSNKKKQKQIKTSFD